MALDKRTTTRLGLALGGGVGLLAAFALLVLWGWQAPIGTPAAIRSAFAPVQYNTAICFLLWGLGLIFLLTRIRLSDACGALVAAVGLLTLAEYTSGYDFGIDHILGQLLEEPDLGVESARPGRMAPSTALCFLMGGLSLVVARRAWGSRQVAGGVMAPIILALAAVALFGYSTGGQSASGWGASFDMGQHTALGLVVAAGVLFVFALVAQRHLGGRVSVPITVMLICSLASINLWNTLASHETEQLQDRVQSELNDLAIELRELTDIRVKELLLMARRWEIRGGTPREEWVDAAAANILSRPGYEAIGWADQTLDVRWVVPQESRTLRLMGLNLLDETPYADAVEQSVGDQQPRLTELFALPGDRQGFGLFCPVVVEGALDGFLFAFYDAEAMFESPIYRRVERGLWVTLLGAERAALRERATISSGEWVKEAVIPIGNLHWRLRMQPGEEWLAEAENPMSEVTLAIGLILSAILAATVFVHQIWRFLAAEIGKAKSELQQAHDNLELRVEKRTEELRIANHDLERTNRELDAFAYVASHDLKAPLRAIDNLSSWIVEDAGEVLPDLSRQHLEKLQQRVMRMDKLIDNLLQYSRAGRINHENEQVACQTLIQEIIDLLAPENGFRVTIEGKMPVLETDRVPLRQVLMNLIGNAIKHHDRSDGQVKVSVRDSGTAVKFLVEDDGPGIPAQFHERIFAMFQTLRPRDEVEGSGMGLALVKKIVETRGGRIEVASTPGCGSSFRFTWPKLQQRKVLDRAG